MPSESLLKPTSRTAYIGRFAPSPTGHLHFGSLVSALASFLDARSANGTWLVRMEDLDPPRELPGAASAILQALDDHGLHWNGSVLYQHQRLDAYQHTLDSLRTRDLVYRCNCTRQDLQRTGGIYAGHCRTQLIDANTPHAWRLKLYDTANQAGDICIFDDVFQGTQQQNLRLEAGDQILKRKDGLFAYQLAVVADDIEQKITHIIRGMDLLEVTGRQIVLFTLLNHTPPQFGHVPLAMNPHGQKLSKQNHARPLNAAEASSNLWYALGFLGQNPPPDLKTASVEEILNWGILHWQRAAVSAQPIHALSPEPFSEESPSP